MEPFLVEIPFAYLASTRTPRGRKWEPRWITETTTVAIARVDPAARRTVARILSRDGGTVEDVDMVGRAFVSDLSSPLRGYGLHRDLFDASASAKGTDEDLFAAVASGRVPVPGGRWSSWPFPVPTTRSHSEPEPGRVVFTNPKGLAGAGVGTVEPGDGARDAALAACARAASRLVSVGGAILRRTVQPAVVLDMSVRDREDGEMRGTVGRSRSEEKDVLVLPLTALSDPAFDAVFFDRSLIDRTVEIVDPRAFAGFDVVRANARTLAATIQRSGMLPSNVAWASDPDTLDAAARILSTSAALLRLAADPKADAADAFGRLRDLSASGFVPSWVENATAWIAGTRRQSMLGEPEDVEALSIPF